MLVFKDVQQRMKSGGLPADDVQSSVEQEVETELTPDEVQEQATIHYGEQLLNLLRQLPPPGFESLCQRLLRTVGFQNVFVTGRSGDGGIDGHGILEVNAFVNFRVLFQCKRYSGSVGAPQVRDFRGAMSGRTDRGIILTTGTFTSDAKKEAERDGVSPIELVDGQKLIALFKKYEFGLQPVLTYKLDADFFEPYKTQQTP